MDLAVADFATASISKHTSGASNLNVAPSQGIDSATFVFIKQRAARVVAPAGDAAT